MNSPPITVTRLDLKRLESHLETAAVRSLPGSSLLREELMRATVVESELVRPNIVTMNSTVRFVDEQTKAVFELTLVYPPQAGTPGTVSVFAPAGSALLGLAVGQSIKWQVPGGRLLQLRVDAVLSQPEALKEYHR